MTTKLFTMYSKHLRKKKTMSDDAHQQEGKLNNISDKSCKT